MFDLGQIKSPFPFVIAHWCLPGKGDLESLVSSDEGRQACEGLLPRATHTHQQSMSSWGTDDAGNANQVGHGILSNEN